MKCQEYQKMPKAKKQKYYCVVKGRKTGIFLTWDECSKHVIACPGSKYKAFGLLEDALQHMKDHNVTVQEEFLALVETNTKEHTTTLEETTQVAVATTEKTTTKDKKHSTVQTDNSEFDVVAYSDGSCRNNGTEFAYGGYGVVLTGKMTDEIAKPLKGTQTNQRAELRAILETLLVVPPKMTLKLVTDSKYGINCCTVWREGWKKTDPELKRVKNRDLILEIYENLDERTHKVQFAHVKGHSGHELNTKADHLANQGAMMNKQWFY